MLSMKVLIFLLILIFVGCLKQPMIAVSIKNRTVGMTENNVSPFAPQNLVIHSGLTNIQLSWDVASGSGTITYNIYRSTSSGVGYSLIALDNRQIATQI